MLPIHQSAVCSELTVFPESEQGASKKRHCSPASLEFTMALEWNPEFIQRTEPGYEQCREQKSGSIHNRIFIMQFILNRSDQYISISI